METPEFDEGIARLTELGTQPLAVMCAEALWWRCHRALISDFLKERGVQVIHIIDREKIELHPFTSAARIVGGKLSYRELDRLL